MHSARLSTNQNCCIGLNEYQSLSVFVVSHNQPVIDNERPVNKLARKYHRGPKVPADLRALPSSQRS